jgi:hypothetical protein
MGDKPYPWTPEIEAEIFERLANAEPLADICEDDWLPSARTVYRRLKDDEPFRQRYAHAREMQADTIFDEILQIADDARNDWMERKGAEDKGWTENGEHIQRSRLRIDARKWMAGKLRPKVYGDKLEVSGAGDDGAHVHRVEVSFVRPDPKAANG